MDWNVLGKTIAASCFVLLVSWAWRILNWAWFTPKKIEKRLRQQGFRGNPYRLLVGDAKDSAEMLQEAMSNKPMKFNHVIAPRLMPHIVRTIETYGKNSFSWMGTVPCINVMEPELVKEILSQQYKFEKHFTIHKNLNPFTQFLLTGVGAYEGEKWAKHRRIINPAFTLEKLKNMLPSFAFCYDKMVSQWEQIIAREGSYELDVSPAFDVLTFDAISRVAFGSTYEEGDKIFHLLKELTDLTVQVLSSFYIPGSRYFPNKTNNRMKEINKEVTDILRNMVNKRIKAMYTGESSGDDLLGVLLESNFQEIQKQRGKKNVGMSIEDVIEECKMFYFVGQETTGILLTWTIIMLSKHPEWQERAREEVLEAFGQKRPDFEHVNRLKYVSMILYEVLRLYPPVIDLNKVVHADTKLGPYIIPAGTQLKLPILLLQTEKSIWGEDALEFNPMRFANGVVSATKNKVAYLAFSWGPRGCLGQNFAMLQAKLGVAMILQRFTFDLSPSYVHAPTTILTLFPQYGSHIIFKKLER